MIRAVPKLATVGSDEFSPLGRLFILSGFVKKI
jgi:hypothetical protein